ncbi:MAG: protein-L-isoaspartate O-methyltransferase [Candidatus Poseidoniaceae archaeon]|nr:protein-L-isoaspartate O-methyltransferase [Candidatus Poseidoniaceae archaeon]
MELSPSQADLSGPTANDSTAPEGLVFHYADEAKPLATPWQVAVERAKMVRKCGLPGGAILDPACGSGIQLAAYCAMISREGFGIEMDESTAKAANSNLRRVAEHGFGQSLLSSTIKIGDGTIGEYEQKFAMLHLDPARPRNSRTHGLDEMAPRLPEIFEAWKDALNHGERGPAILLDLSPRLDNSQRLEVEEIVESFWPNIGKTWVWTSRGRGRVDRLSLWVGQLSTPGISRRFVRIPPDFKDKPLIIEGDFEEISEHRRPPRKGEHVSILDAALVESGLALHFLRDLIPGQEITWSIIDGRRPQIHHSQPIIFENKQEKMLVQATGRIVKLVHSELSLETISHLVEASRDYGFGKLTLRVALEPQLQPKLQGSLDRQLFSKGGEHVGFVAKQPHDSMLLLCLETQ